LFWRMNILLLNANLIGVGTYVRALQFGKTLVSAGHSATLCTVSRTKRWRKTTSVKNGLTIIEMPAAGYKTLPGWGAGWVDILQRVRLISIGNFDCVWGFEYQPDVAWPIYLTHKRYGYRFLSDWCDWHAGASNVFHHIQMAHRVDGYFEEKIRFQAAQVSVISSLLRERAIKIGISSEKIVFIQEGVDTNYIKPFPKEEMRSRFGFPVHIPMVATITDSSMHIPVEILCRIRQVIGDVKLLVIGRKDGTVARTALRLGLSSEVYETGFVADEDLPRYLACADACFLPLVDNLSNQARWPAKVNDFLAAGKPTVISPVGDIARLFEQNPIGGLANTVDDFADELVRFLNNPTSSKASGECARQVAEKQLDWGVLQNKILQMVAGNNL
jgi:glycosyltransferase involved in cell wall biosynthesis